MKPLWMKNLVKTIFGSVIKNRNKPTVVRTLQIEPLEIRLTPTVISNDCGTLFVTGTSGDDNTFIWLDGTDLKIAEPSVGFSLRGGAFQTGNVVGRVTGANGVLYDVATISFANTNSDAALLFDNLTVEMGDGNDVLSLGFNPINGFATTGLDFANPIFANQLTSTSVIVNLNGDVSLQTFPALSGINTLYAGGIISSYNSDLNINNFDTIINGDLVNALATFRASQGSLLIADPNLLLLPDGSVNSDASGTILLGNQFIDPLLEPNRIQNDIALEASGNGNRILINNPLNNENGNLVLRAQNLTDEVLIKSIASNSSLYPLSQSIFSSYATLEIQTGGDVYFEGSLEIGGLKISNTNNFTANGDVTVNSSSFAQFGGIDITSLTNKNTTVIAFNKDVVTNNNFTINNLGSSTQAGAQFYINKDALDLGTTGLIFNVQCDFNATTSATATASINAAGTVSSVTPLVFGKGYTSAPTVTISAPNTPATGTAILGVGATAGTVTSISPVLFGTNYTSAPLVTISGGGGNGATATAVLGTGATAGQVIGYTINNPGSGYTSAPTVNIVRISGASASAVLGTGVGAGTITSLNPLSPGSGYTVAPIVTITGGGGTGAVYTAVLTGGNVTSYTLVSAGSGYTSTPTVTVDPAQITASANAVLSGGTVTSVNPVLTGLGYTSAPLVTITGGGGSGAVYTANVVGGQVTSYTLVSAGTGYTSTPTVTVADPGTASATAVLGTGATAGQVIGFNITDPGFGYTSPPTVTVASTDGIYDLSILGQTSTIGEDVTINNLGALTLGTVSNTEYSSATGLAVLGSGIVNSIAPDNVVFSVTETVTGTGYTSAPSVLFSGGGGSGAAATASLNADGTISYTVTSQGSGYTSAPTVFLSGGGFTTRASAVATLTSLVGSNYTIAPLVTFIGGGGGTGAAATSVLGTGLQAGKVVSYNITNTGIGYTSAPTVILTRAPGDTTGSGASAIARITTIKFDTVTAINPVLQGSGYTSPPSVTIAGANSNAIAVPVLGTIPGTSDQVTGINPIDGGSGYTSSPIVTISAPSSGGVQAEYIAILKSDGSIDSYTPVKTGSGYTSTPTITITRISGATATAVLGIGASAGTITSLTPNLIGCNYTSVPTVTIAPNGVGVTATATAILSVSSIKPIVAGSGYTSTPTVVFSLPALPGGVQATALAILGTGATAGQVVGYNITNSGSGYTSPPTVTIIPAVGDTTGSGATATATLSVTNYIVTSPGSGYTSAPTVTVAPDQITATATAVLTTGGSIASIIAAPVNASQVPSGLNPLVTASVINGFGLGYTSVPRVTITGGGGSGADYIAVLGTGVTAGQVIGYIQNPLNPNAAGFGYTSAPSVTVADPGTASAVAILGGSKGDQVVGYTITDPGCGYSSVPAVTVAPSTAVLNASFTAGGFFSALNLSTTEATSFNIFSDITAGLDVSTNRNIFVKAAATTVPIGSEDRTFTIQSRGGDVSLTGNITMEDYTPITATAKALLLLPALPDALTGVSLSNIVPVVPGSGYTSAPLVTISAPTVGGTQATATAVLGSGSQQGQIVSFNITNAGSGYTSAPTVTVAPVQVDATAIANVASGQVISINPVVFGSGYTSAPMVNITGGGGLGATAIAILGAGPTAGQVVGYTITNPGSGYVSPPIITVASSSAIYGSNLTVWSGIATPSFKTKAVAGVPTVLNGQVLAIPLTTLGKGYTTAPVVNIVGGGGSGATAIANLIPASSSATVAPVGITATAVATVTNPGPSPLFGQVTSINPVVLGSNYTNRYFPTVTISAPGTRATATATINVANGTINSPLTVLNGGITNVGSNYSSPPTVTLTGGGGTFTTATAVLGTGALAGTVVRIIVTGSTGYTSVPTVTIAPPGLTADYLAVLGTGAQAGQIVSYIPNPINPFALGSGYITAPVVTIRDPGITATAAVTVGTGAAAGTIAAVSVVNSGFNYSQAPLVTIDAPPNGGVQATAIARVQQRFGGFVTSFVITNPGSGYDSLIPNITITNPGSGYTSLPTVTLTDPEGDITVQSVTGPNRTFTINDAKTFNANSTIQVKNLVLEALNDPNTFSVGEYVFNGNIGLTNNPTAITAMGGLYNICFLGAANIFGGGVDADSFSNTGQILLGNNSTDTFNFTSTKGVNFGPNTTVAGIAIVDGNTTIQGNLTPGQVCGSTLASASAVLVTGTKAVATIATDSVTGTVGVTGIVSVVTGYGYTSVPTVSITGGGGLGATAIAVLGSGKTAGQVVRYIITNPGLGYTSIPTVTLTPPPGTGQLGAILPIDFGSGYTVAPLVVVSGGGGNGAAVTAVLGTGARAGQVVDYIITNAGSGYTSAPTISFASAGILTFMSPLVFDNATASKSATYSPVIIGNKPGVNQSQVVTQAGYSLVGNPILSPSLSSSNVIPGTSFTIVNQLSGTSTGKFSGLTDPSTNTYSILNEGDTFYAGSATYVISYKGGAGSDVVLTFVRNSIGGNNFTADVYYNNGIIEVHVTSTGSNVDATVLSIFNSSSDVITFDAGANNAIKFQNFTGGALNVSSINAQIVTIGLKGNLILGLQLIGNIGQDKFILQDLNSKVLLNTGASFGVDVDTSTVSGGDDTLTVNGTVKVFGIGNFKTSNDATTSKNLDQIIVTESGVIQSVGSGDILLVANHSSTSTISILPPPVSSLLPMVLTASGTAVLGTGVNAGTISSIQTGVLGSGYTFTPTVTITGGGGLRASATAIMGSGVTAGQVIGYTITDCGFGYTSTPTIVVAPPQDTAIATSTLLGNSVGLVTPISAGTGYTSAPIVTIDGPGIIPGATATVVLGTGPNVGTINSLIPNSTGMGYTSAPTVNITGGGGTGAVYTANVVGGMVVSYTQVSAGFGYTSIPTVTVTPAQIKATANAALTGGTVTSITPVLTGLGYTSIPMVTITGGGGSGAVYTANLLNGMITGYTLVSAGSGYTSTPTVTVADPGTATAIAILGTAANGTAGQVVGYTITDPGFGYTFAPKVSVVAPSLPSFSLDLTTTNSSDLTPSGKVTLIAGQNINMGGNVARTKGGAINFNSPVILTQDSAVTTGSEGNISVQSITGLNQTFTIYDTNTFKASSTIQVKSLVLEATTDPLSPTVGDYTFNGNIGLTTNPTAITANTGDYNIQFLGAANVLGGGALPDSFSNSGQILLGNDSTDTLDFTSGVNFGQNTIVKGTSTVTGSATIQGNLTPANNFSDTSVGILTFISPLTFNNISSNIATYSPVIIGNTPGVNQSQVVTKAGYSSLNNPVLSPSLGSSKATPGTSFTIVDQVSGTSAGKFFGLTNPSTNTYSILNEGDIFYAGNSTYRISYTGGTGSSVVLTFLGSTIGGNNFTANVYYNSGVIEVLVTSTGVDVDATVLSVFNSASDTITFNAGVGNTIQFKDFTSGNLNVSSGNTQTATIGLNSNVILGLKLLGNIGQDKFVLQDLNSKVLLNTAASFGVDVDTNSYSGGEYQDTLTVDGTVKVIGTGNFNTSNNNPVQNLDQIIITSSGSIQSVGSGNILLVANHAPTSTISISSPSVSGSSTMVLTASAKAVLGTGANVGTIASLTPTIPGSGYISVPTVTITGGGGTGAVYTANLVGGMITSYTQVSAGSGYTSTPTVTVASPQDIAIASSNLVGGSVSSITPTAVGAGYTSAPAVTIAGPGISAIGNAILGTGISAGTLVFINPVVLGTNYTIAPIVTITGGGGTGATATAVLGTGAKAGQVVSYTITNPGSGYISNPTITITRIAGATATAVLGIGSNAGTISKLNPVLTGIQYLSAPAVTISASGITATGNAVLGNGASAGTIASIIPVLSGTNYMSVPTVTFTGGGGTGAAATAVLGTGATAGQVVSYTITNAGSGYTSIPIIAVSAPGVTATATANLVGGMVTSYTITNPGSGYASIPAVTIASAQITANAAAVLSGGAITSVTPVLNGFGYTSVPTVTITGGGGTGAVYTANLVGGMITSYTQVSAGSGYTSTPTVTVADPGVATATAVLGTGATAGQVVSYTITDPGFGYTSAPAVLVDRASLSGFSLDLATTNPSDLTASGSVTLLAGQNISMGGNVVRTNGGTININSSVNLTQDSYLTTGNNKADVTFASTIDENFDLTVKSFGSLNLQGNVGSTTRLGDITTQSLTGLNVLNANNVPVAVNAASFNTAGGVSGNIVFSGLQNYSTTTGLNLASNKRNATTTDSGTTGDITLNGAISLINGAVLNLAHAGALNINANITNGLFTELSSSSSSVVNFGGQNPVTIISDAGITFNSPVNLGVDTNLQSTNNFGVTFNNTLNGANDLAINTTGSLVFMGAVGATAPLNSISTKFTGVNSTTNNNPLQLDVNNTLKVGIFDAMVNGDINMIQDQTYTGNGLTLVTVTPSSTIRLGKIIGNISSAADVSISNAGALILNDDIKLGGKFTQGALLTGITLTNAGSNYTSVPSVSISGGNGSGVAATAIASLGISSIKSQATATAIIAPLTATAIATISGGQLSSINPVSLGGGYVSVPAVTITGGGGTGATATAVLGTGAKAGQVVSYTITNSGSGYSTSPTVTVASATSSVVNQINSSYSGSGYSVAPTVTVSAPPAATATATLVSGAVTSITPTSVSGGYLSTPTVTMPLPGITATATAVLTGGVVTSFTITNGGSNYSSPPTVTLNGGGFTTAATATAVLTGGVVTAINIISGGTGYTSAPTVTIAPVGTRATATAVLGTGATAGQVVGYTITNPGTNYISAPTVTVTGPGKAATAIAVLGTGVQSGQVARYIVTDPGSGYTTAPIVTLSPLNSPVTIGNTGGSGYLVGDLVTLVVVGSGGTPANAIVSSADLTTGALTGLTLLSPGNYTSGSLLGLAVISTTGRGADATVDASGFVESVALTSAGSGYTSAPTISFLGGSGVGATATANLTSPTGQVYIGNLGNPSTITIKTGIDTDVTFTSKTTLNQNLLLDGSTSTKSDVTFGAIEGGTLSLLPALTIVAGGNLAFNGSIGAANPLGAIDASANILTSVQSTSSNLGINAASFKFSATGVVSLTAPQHYTGTKLEDGSVFGLDLTNTTSSSLVTLGDITTREFFNTQVGSVKIDNEGSGYTSSPTVTFSGGGGTGATGSAFLGISNSTAVITASGSGYTLNQIVQIVQLGFNNQIIGSAIGQVTGVDAINNGIVSLSILSPGYGFTDLNNLSVISSGFGGIGAGAIISASGFINAVNITDGGIGYTTAPTVVFSSGVATATALLAKKSNSVTISNSGPVTFQGDVNTRGNFNQIGQGAVTIGTSSSGSINLNSAGGNVFFNTSMVQMQDFVVDTSINTVNSGNITFNSSIDSIGAKAITLTSGVLSSSYSSGNILLKGSLGISPMGNIQVNNSNDFSVIGNVIGNSLVVNSAKNVVNFAGAITTRGTTAVGTNTVSLSMETISSGSSIVFQNPVITAGNVIIKNAGTFITTSIADISIQGIFQQTGAGISSISGDISTTVGGINFAGAVGLSGTPKFISKNTVSTSSLVDIAFQNDVNGLGGISLDTTGRVLFLGNVGLLSPLSSIEIVNANYTNPLDLVAVQFNSSASQVTNANKIILPEPTSSSNINGRVIFNGSTNISNAFTTTRSYYDIFFNSNVTFSTNMNFLNGGKVKFSGTTNFTGSATFNNSGTLEASGIIVSAGSLIVQRPLAITNNLQLYLSSSNNSFTSSVSGNSIATINSGGTLVLTGNSPQFTGNFVVNTNTINGVNSPSTLQVSAFYNNATVTLNGGTLSGNGRVLNVLSATTSTAIAVVGSGANAGKIRSINVTNPGSGYVSAPTVTIAAPPAGGTRATATAILGTGAFVGQIVGFSITNPGSGYTFAPSVTVSLPTAGGTFSPGAVLGNLTVGNQLVLGANNTFTTSINGVSPGTFGQTTIISGGSFGINNANLAIVLNTNLTAGNQIPLVNLGGGSSSLGNFTFNGAALTQGASFSISSNGYTNTFTISYTGGDGNDIVLTVSGSTASSPPPGSFTASQVIGVDYGGGSVVQINYTNGTNLSFFAYSPSYTGGVRVALGDVNGDGIDELITGTGVGGGPHIKVFNLQGGQPVEVASFFAFEPTFMGGVNISTGDINGDGLADIIIGAGAGGGPRVKVFNGAANYFVNATKPLMDFFVYDPSFTGGVTVAAGNRDGYKGDEVITGSGFGGGPNIRSFNQFGQMVDNFFAFNSSITSGVFVAAGYVDDDAIADIIAGTGFGTPTQVAAFFSTGANPTAVPFVPNFVGGARVGIAMNSSGKQVFAAAAGPGGAPQVNIFNNSLDTTNAFIAIDSLFSGGLFLNTSIYAARPSIPNS